MKTLILGIVALGVSAASFAALPPQAESSKQIAAVATSPDVVGQFRSWIESVTYQRTADAGYWLARSGACSVRVDITCRKTPPGFAGPCQHVLKVYPKQCAPDREE